jgi:hypothetical protein
MTVKEILEQKETYRNADIQVLFDVSHAKASEMIALIKSVSDRTGIKGRVHRLDYQDYLNRGK